MMIGIGEGWDLGRGKQVSKEGMDVGLKLSFVVQVTPILEIHIWSMYSTATFANEDSTDVVICCVRVLKQYINEHADEISRSNTLD
jgi:hypothetical protein